MSLTGSKSRYKSGSSTLPAASKPIDIPTSKAILHGYNQFMGNDCWLSDDLRRSSLDDQQDSPPQKTKSPHESRWTSGEMTFSPYTKRRNMS